MSECSHSLWTVHYANLHAKCRVSTLDAVAKDTGYTAPSGK